MKPLVIYHKSCADGFAAAFAAWTVLGDEAEYVAIQYDETEIGPLGDEFGQLRLVTKSHVLPIKDREVYILDFSFPREIMDRIFAEAERVVWLDHHKTAFEMWCPEFFAKPASSHEYGETDRDHYIRLHFSKSGAVLTWEYFHPNTKLPKLFEYIDAYDRGGTFKGWAAPEVELFKSGIWSYAPWSFEQWDDLFGTFSINSGVNETVEVGETLHRDHMQRVTSTVKDATRKCFIHLPDEGISFLDTVGWPGLAANCPPDLYSAVGHELANESGTYGLCWCMMADGTIKCGLRSNGNYDVSAIAKALGGGGHLNASGFSIDIETLLGWLK